MITLSLCFCIAWGGFELDALQNGGAFGTFFALGAVILGIMGASQINSSVFSARASGIMDFHRVSPLSPTELALGFFFGARFASTCSSRARYRSCFSAWPWARPTSGASSSS